MGHDDQSAYGRVWEMIESLAAAGCGDEPIFILRLAASQEFEQLETALRLRGYWRGRD